MSYNTFETHKFDGYIKGEAEKIWSAKMYGELNNTKITIERGIHINIDKLYDANYKDEL